MRRRRKREQNAVFCSHPILLVNRTHSIFSMLCATNLRMTQSLFDNSGNRKYLVARERLAFVSTAFAEGGAVGSFCITLAITGARISEVLALTDDRLDVGNAAIVFETLKQRKKGVFRAVPVPTRLLTYLQDFRNMARVHSEQECKDNRLWPWGRTTGWKKVKDVMHEAGIAENLCKPKALRHAFAVEAGQKGIPLNIVQRWLGHARIETTAIYASAIGDEERNLARRAWSSIEPAIPELPNVSNRHDPP